ncbi:MAG TPA: M20/M25/M40 family metallo-hydrolase [Candidatus Binataceae bacterium]|nr:M20/M25/M40 family metallo-hydrolase [Candidatus Binataceae bacterium]
MDLTYAREYIDRVWNESAVPELIEYVRIPNKSPAFDREWQANGHMEQAIARFSAWATARAPEDGTVEIQRIDKRTPLLVIDIPGQSDDCVLLYGHLDKQPEMTGWREGLGPWQPVIDGERLYGRGAADDGYAMFACLSAIGALRADSTPHARCVVLIEACEESGSSDLPAHIERLGARLGRPSLVIGLDSGCGNYDQLWCTTSLRGLIGGVLRVEVLTEGIHSGASGIVPDSFRIARQLMSRIEDEKTGRILAPEFYPEIPPERLKEAAAAAAILGESMRGEFPLVEGARPVSEDLAELILNRDWRPALSTLGGDGLPQLANAGNVLRPMTALKLSLRIPPNCDPKAATQALRTILERDPPYGAKVSFKGDWGAAGWNAPALAPWLEQSLDRASREWFGKPPAYMGLGGTIPFMSMLGERFPEAQFLITGVLGPHSNAHGPNEFLHLPTARRISGCVAQVIADHFRRS